MLRRSETGVVIRTTLHDLALFRQVLTPGAQRVFDGAHGSIEHSAHFLPFIAYELCMSCLHSGEFASREASVRPIPSASAISVTVAPEASAFAMRANRPSRRIRQAAAVLQVRFVSLKLFVVSRVPIGATREVMCSISA